MLHKIIVTALGSALVLGGSPAAAQSSKASSGRQEQARGMAQIPVCTRKLATIAIVEPENQWWRELNLGSPEAILKIFVQKSGCFGLVNRGRSMQSRAMERALADNGELQSGSNVGRGQVKTADYFLEPDIVSANRNSGGGGVGAGLGGAIGGLFGGVGWWGGFGAAGATGYQNTEIGQIIVLAYLDAYTKLVTQLGGLPANAAAAAPQSR